MMFWSESVHSGQNGSQEEEDSRLSAICNTYLAAQEHELHNITLPCVREDSSVFQGQSCISCTCKPPKFGGYERTRLMGPYDEFLDDIRRRKQEAERDARKKAKHVELILKWVRTKQKTLKPLISVCVWLWLRFEALTRQVFMINLLLGWEGRKTL